jgi:hypothetical protein
MTEPKPVVVTYATADCDGLSRFLRSLDRWGWDRVLLRGDRWEGSPDRLRRVAAALPGLRDRYSHCLHLDAYDVLAVGPPSEFRPPPLPLWQTAEKNCWPDRSRIPLYPPSPTPWRFVNSNFVLDLRRVDLLRIESMPADCRSDQLHLTDNFLRGCGEVGLDSGCEYVQSIAFDRSGGVGPSSFRVEGDRLRNLVTNTLPVFAHGNGATKMDWLPGYGD